MHAGETAMSIIDEMREWMRDRKLRRMLAEEDASARKLQEVVEAIIDRARRSEEAGVRKDKVLFAFESDFEQISDRIARLRESGDKETYRDLYARLYAFADERMADSYMPMYLFIMYRYANALLETGEAAAAAQMFEKLRAGTERLIGIRNTYGLHCLERVTAAAVQSGQPEKALEALEEMKEISAAEFGPHSAAALAVRRIEERIKKEIEATW